MNGWLMEDEEELERNEVDSDLESIASSKPKRVELEDTCESGRSVVIRRGTTLKEGIYNYGGQHSCTCAITQKMALSSRSGPNDNNNENPDIAAIIVQQLQTILPHIVNQVTNNMNNANGVNGGNNGCTYKGFMACNPKEYDGKGVCHEKVLEIPVEDGRTLRVHGERIIRITKALKSIKEDKPKLGDISVVRDFEHVFSEDLSRLPPQ
nr:putative reverse transcriptase domain-containing protein [Tanacetum cinerariifolium]